MQLSERYGPKNPQVIENENAITDTTKQYQDGAARGGRSDPQRLRDGARPRNGASPRRSKQSKGAAMDLNRKSVSYTVLEREAQSNRQIYDSLIQRQNELQIVSNSGGNNVRLMDRAVVPGCAVHARHPPQLHAGRARRASCWRSGWCWRSTISTTR